MPIFSQCSETKKNRHDHGDLSWSWCVCAQQTPHVVGLDRIG